MFLCRYLWIKHNNQNDIKEGPVSNFMPNIDSKIDAAYWVPQRATAYLFNGTDVVWPRASLYCPRDVNNTSSSLISSQGLFSGLLKDPKLKAEPETSKHLGFRHGSSR